MYDDLSTVTSARDGDAEPRPAEAGSTWAHLLDAANTAVESVAGLLTQPAGRSSQGPQHLVMGAGNRELVLGTREGDDELRAERDQRAARRLLQGGRR